MSDTDKNKPNAGEAGEASAGEPTSEKEHPLGEHLAAFALGEISSAGRKAVAEHLETCERCWQEVEQLRALAGETAEALHAAAPPGSSRLSADIILKQKRRRRATRFVFLAAGSLVFMLLLISLAITGLSKKQTAICEKIDMPSEYASRPKAASKDETTISYPGEEPAASDELSSESPESDFGLVGTMGVGGGGPVETTVTAGKSKKEEQRKGHVGFELEKNGRPEGDEESDKASRRRSRKEYAGSAAEEMPPSVDSPEIMLEEKARVAPPLPPAAEFGKKRTADRPSRVMLRGQAKIIPGNSSPSSISKATTGDGRFMYDTGVSRAAGGEFELPVQTQRVDEKSRIIDETGIAWNSPPPAKHGANAVRQALQEPLAQQAAGTTIQNEQQVSSDDYMDFIQNAQEIYDYSNSRYSGQRSAALNKQQRVFNRFSEDKKRLAVQREQLRNNRGNRSPRQFGPDYEPAIRAYRYYSAQTGMAIPLRKFLENPVPPPPPLITDEGLDEDKFIEKYGTRPFVDASRDNLSTFGMDVSTASYTRTRALLRSGRLPPPDSVRTEEFLNYFRSDMEVPGDETFAVLAEGMPAPFGGYDDMRLLEIAIKSRRPRPRERKPAVLTFVIDTSGSMARPGRMDAVKSALRELAGSLRPEDLVCIAGFGDRAQLLLPPTRGSDKTRIIAGINALSPDGGTNIDIGLRLGYRLADENRSATAVNRLVLVSDGITGAEPENAGDLVELAGLYASRGIDVSVIGVGPGSISYDDSFMRKLAAAGDGAAYYVDNPTEAHRIFNNQLPPHLDILARDAKVQVEFNTDVVERYRLLGYEKRAIRDVDFRNDAVDAGEITHDTDVVVLYELRLRPFAHGVVGTVFLRWKDPGYSQLPVVERHYEIPPGVFSDRTEDASARLHFLACIAEFAELLRGSRWAQDGSYAALLEELDAVKKHPCFNNRRELEELRGLVVIAQRLSVYTWLRNMSTVR